MLIAKITTCDIDRFYSGKLDEGYNPKTIRVMHSMLSRGFGQAMKWGLIRNNPILNTSPPKMHSKGNCYMVEKASKNFFKPYKGRR